MPTSHTILEQLALASNRAVTVAIGWHVALTLAVAALILGWRPSQRAAGLMLATPVMSAAAVALAFGNPFNGVILGALACALVLIALRLPVDRVARGANAATAVGVLLIGFGSWYPHFLERGTPLAYLYAAPTGLIPCPTLSVVIGFALLGGGLGARAWSITLAAVGLFYGLFGVVRLGVYLDIPLILGASALVHLASSGTEAASCDSPFPFSAVRVKSGPRGCAMSDPAASETKESVPQASQPASRPRKPLVWAGAAVAILIVWGVWGRGRAPGRGGTIPAAITLVTTDHDDLACASDKAVGQYRCEFRAPGTPWPNAPAPADRLAGYYTVEQKLYVIPGLFEQPVLAKRYADEEQRHIPHDQRPRFVATCQLKLVDHLKDFQTRWAKDGGWNHQDDAWVAEPSDCRIQ